MPKGWENDTIIPILKNVDKSKCHKYREIFLLDVTFKAKATLLNKRLEVILDPQIGEYQTDFRKGRKQT